MKRPTIASTNFTYNCFHEAERFEIYIYLRNLAEYIAANKIKNVAFMDRSARMAWIGFHAYWKKHFKRRKMPGIYFLNPTGFKMHSTMAKITFRRAFPKLLKENKKPLVLFDTCCHTGSTMRSVIGILEQLSFDNVAIVTAKAPSGKSGITPSCIIDNGLSNVGGCYPFGKSDMVAKTEFVFCRPENNCDRGRAIRERKEIQHLMLNSPFPSA